MTGLNFLQGPDDSRPRGGPTVTVTVTPVISESEPESGRDGQPALARPGSE